MDIEEPTAASIISQSLNIEQELSLRTSELTAVAILKGEMIIQMGKDLSQKVAYKSVIAQVRRELNVVADDLHLADVFDYLRSLAVGKNTYVDRLLQFGAAFVDSKKRQLRFSAFAVANKINHDYPLTRVAVIERAYYKKPQNGFCPNPETQWTELEPVYLNLLEQMLFYFHTTRQADVAKLEPEEQVKLLANVDVNAASALFAVAGLGKKNKRQHYDTKKQKQVQHALLKSTLKYFEQIAEKQAANSDSQEHTENIAAVADEKQTAVCPDWINFDGVKDDENNNEDPSTGNAEKVPSSATNIPQFDEQSGARVTAEEEFPAAGPSQTTAQVLVLPWRQWHRENTLGALEADKASAVAVLHGLHENFDVTRAPIEIIYVNNKPKVVATQNVEKDGIWLPPCVPKQSRVLESSEHSSAVTLHVSVLRSAESAANSPAGPILRQRAFKLTPWSASTWTTWTTRYSAHPLTLRRTATRAKRTMVQASN